MPATCSPCTIPPVCVCVCVCFLFAAWLTCGVCLCFYWVSPIRKGCNSVLFVPFLLLEEPRPYLPSSFSDTGLDLNTHYQLTHLTADLSLLIDALRAEPGAPGFPPPLRYRISPAKVLVDASTQTESSLMVVSEDSSDPYEDNDDMVYSDPGSDLSPHYTPSSPDFSPDHSLYPQPPSPTDYSPTSSVYSP